MNTPWRFAATATMPVMASDIYRHPQVQALVHAALHEDLGYVGDLTCQCVVDPAAWLHGTVTAKAAGVVCGLPLFQVVAEHLGGGLRLVECAADGTAVECGAVVARIEGPAATVLMAERTALNLCQRLSGVATTTRRYVAIVAGTRAGIYDTRKTAPGQRLLQKHAVLAGGGRNHRIGLFDQVLIKENHIALMAPGSDGSSPASAVRRCRERLGPEAVVQVEIEQLDDLGPVMEAGADLVLLDNMGPALLAQAVAMRDARGADPQTTLAGVRAVGLEASGGITDANLRAVAESGVDRISIGALTHSAPALDLSLRCSIP